MKVMCLHIGAEIEDPLWPEVNRNVYQGLNYGSSIPL